MSSTELELAYRKGIPKVVDVLGSKYHIELVKDSRLVDPTGSHPDLAGWISTRDHLIRLHINSTKRQVWECLFHELFHAIIERLGIPIEFEAEEKVINLLTVGWMDVLLDIGFDAKKVKG